MCRLLKKVEKHWAIETRLSFSKQVQKISEIIYLSKKMGRKKNCTQLNRKQFSKKSHFLLILVFSILPLSHIHTLHTLSLFLLYTRTHTHTHFFVCGQNEIRSECGCRSSQHKKEAKRISME